jgi:crossover junction endodeoxyribonuclease RusA
MMSPNGEITGISFGLTADRIIKDNGSRGIGVRSGRRYHDAEGDRKRALKKLAYAMGMNLRRDRRVEPPVFDRVRVLCVVSYPKGVSTADPGNLSHTVKPLIDGLTMAGYWPDDDSVHVQGPDYRRGPNNPRRGIWTIRFVFRDWEHWESI